MISRRVYLVVLACVMLAVAGVMVWCGDYLAAAASGAFNAVLFVMVARTEWESFRGASRGEVLSALALARAVATIEARRPGGFAGAAGYAALRLTRLLAARIEEGNDGR